MEQVLRDPMGITSSLYIFGVLSLISGIVFPVVLFTMAIYALRSLEGVQKSFGEFFHYYINQIFIESLRSWGKMLLWGLLFILPGLWKFLEYSLVPFVVTSSEKYDAGHEDALQASAKVFRKNWGKILGLFLLFHIFIPLVLTGLFDAYRLLWKTPVASLGLNLIDTYLLVLSTQILFRIFRSEVAAHESHV
ncbi:hypothetical protein [Bdellovibrio sp. HCB2-146]|uniref:hypothetical protein n=1 Tax=Bdellovibrio sp. HCB2-146 TaxID=3394362 RepID=UPI0039BCE2A4